MPTTEIWKRRILKNASNESFQDFAQSGDLDAFVENVDLDPDSKVIMYFSVYLKEAIGKRSKSEWYVVLEAYEKLLRRLEREYNVNLLWWDRWIDLEGMYKSGGEIKKAAELLFERLQAGNEWHPDLKSLFRLCLNQGETDMAKQAANFGLKLLRESNEHNTAYNFKELSSWFEELGVKDSAAEYWEASFRADEYYTIENWKKDRKQTWWPRIIRLYELAGKMEKAVKLCQEVGRTAKADRLIGKASYNVEEVDFFRGLSKKYAIGRVLNDQVMKTEGYIEEGNVKYAVEMDYHVCDGGGPTRLTQLLQDRGLTGKWNYHDKVRENTTKWKSAAEQAIQLKGGDIEAALKSDHYTLDTTRSILVNLEDAGNYKQLLDIAISDTQKHINLTHAVEWPQVEARALYHLGRLSEAAKAAERNYFDVERTLTTDLAVYADQLGVAMIYEEAGDKGEVDRILSKAEMQLRKAGLWQAALGMYFDAGRLADVERVAIEEDEIECVIIAYEAAEKPGEAARIYEEMAGGNQLSDATVVSEDIESSSEPKEDKTYRCSCGEALQPHWKVCPTCGKKLDMVCSCGELLRKGWQICPNCEKKIGS